MMLEPWRGLGTGGPRHGARRPEAIPAPNCSIAVTGIAGPGGGSAEKPVGLVYIAAARPEGDVMTREYRFGDIGRDKVRLATIEKALRLLQDSL